MSSRPPDPAGQWDRYLSLALDRATITYVSLMGHAVEPPPDRCGLFTQHYAWGVKRPGAATDRGRP